MSLESVRVNYSWWVQLFPWGLLAFLIWVTIQFVRIYGTSFPILFVFGVLLFWSSASIIRSPRWFEINAKNVVKVNWFWRREMSWNEIVYLEYLSSQKGLTGVTFFNKEGKKLTINGPSDWWDIDYKRVLEFLDHEVMERGIKVYSKKPSTVIF